MSDVSEIPDTELLRRAAADAAVAGDGLAGLPTTENVQKVVDLLRAKDAETVKAIGHLMDAEEVSLFKMAADIIDAYRRPDGEAEGFATWHRARAGEWRKTAAAYLKDIEPNKSGHDRCITKAEFHEAAAAHLRTAAPGGWREEELVPIIARRLAKLENGERYQTYESKHREDAESIAAAICAASPSPADTGGEKERLRSIAKIIEDVDNRCMTYDGPVPPTTREITLKDIQRIYALALGRKP